MDDEEQSTLELMQRYRRDRRLLLNYILSENLIKKVVLPPGAVSLDDVDLDLVKLLDLSEAIRVYYDGLEFPAVVLNEICNVIVESLRDRLVTGLLQASLDGLLRVILDGGPSRIFFPGDVKILEEDLEILKEFFISGGDGLPCGTVENLVARLRSVISLHGYETRVIIDDLKFASQGNRSKFGADFETLLRILCHRSDTEASQFLKKQYKLPKSSG